MQPKTLEQMSYYFTCNDLLSFFQVSGDRWPSGVKRQRTCGGLKAKDWKADDKAADKRLVKSDHIRPY